MQTKSDRDTAAGRTNTKTGGNPVDAKAGLLAVQVLLTDPEELGNDALEGDLYILRERLNEETGALASDPR